jgi:hypothetical protein
VAFELGIQGFNCHNSQTIHSIAINDFFKGMCFSLAKYLYIFGLLGEVLLD